MNLELIEVNARIEAVCEQRNTLANNLAVLSGKLAAANARAAELEEKLKQAEAKFATLDAASSDPAALPLVTLPPSNGAAAQA